MADNTIKSDIFKFVALRPPVSIEKKNQEANFITDTRQPEHTPVGKLAKTFDTKDGTNIPEQVKSFIEKNKYDLKYPESVGIFNLSKIYDFVLSITKDGFNADSLHSDIVNILNDEITNYLDNNESKTMLENIWDQYYAFYIISRTENKNLDVLTKGLRVFHFLKSLITSKISEYDTLKKIINAKPLVAALFTDLPRPIVRIEKVKTEELKPETINEYNKLWNELVDVQRAVMEIKSIRFDTQLSTESRDIIRLNKETGKEEKNKVDNIRSSLTINKDSFNALHAFTKSILATHNLENINIQPYEAIIAPLQKKLENLYRYASSISDPEFIKLMPAEAKLNPALASLLAERYNVAPLIPFAPRTNIRNFIKPLGIGDLKVVKQVLKKYVAGEIAHIENVLRGEYKERKHRVLDRTEDIFTVTNETNEETTKDTQTTERFELKKESEKTVQEQMSVQAGFTISSSYGMVTFGAHGDFAYSTSNQESNKSASNFAREVIDKSVSRIQKKTKEERTTKKLHEVEEINTHGIDNKDKVDHAVGIYRWVDKYYEAQIYNYGKRMMFEFIIPEPAAFYEYAQEHKPKKNIKAPKALDPNLTHKNIWEGNYQDYIRDYNVQGVTPPPPLYKTVTTSVVKDAMTVSMRDEAEKDRLKEGPGFSVNNKELVVTAGYVSKFGVWWDLSAIWTAYPKMEITIGNKIFKVLDVPRELGDDGNIKFDTKWLAGNQSSINNIEYHWFYSESIIQISVNCTDVFSFTINAYALLERLPETFENWQIQTYEKIMTAYKLMQIEYEQKLAAQDTMQGISIQGQNPGINRVIEKTELKKQCVKMLMDTYQFGSFDSMKDENTEDTNPPDFDIFDALKEGKVIQFFEQAFEWENLTYLFYPYFWARKNQWVHKSNIYDTDPLFTKFLQAGSSRVVIPVHPAYNDVIIYFINSNGKIWGQDGNPPLLQNSDGSLNNLFISIADELRNQTDDLANAVPEGEPWEVVLPTTLVYLQKDSDLPTF